MQKLILKPIFLLFITLLLFAACKKENLTPAQNAANSPWKKDFIFGNFNLSGTPVVTNQDSFSLAYQNDYVPESTLYNMFSDNNFTSTSVHIYVPTGTNYVTVVSNQVIHFQTETGFETANIYNTGSFISRQTIGGQLYSEYQLGGIYTDTPSVNTINFANVVFTCNVTYRENNEVVDSRSIAVEVYKR